MGFTTIVELNHDYCAEIEREPEKFVAQLLDHMRAGKEVYDDGIRIRGGTIVSTFHRSDNHFDRLWTKYKSGLRAFFDLLSEKSAEMKRKGFKF